MYVCIYIYIYIYIILLPPPSSQALPSRAQAQACKRAAASIAIDINNKINNLEQILNGVKNDNKKNDDIKEETGNQKDVCSGRARPTGPRADRPCGRQSTGTPSGRGKRPQARRDVIDERPWLHSSENSGNLIRLIRTQTALPGERTWTSKAWPTTSLQTDLCWTYKVLVLLLFSNLLLLPSSVSIFWTAG